MVRSADVAVRSFQDQPRATKAARTRIDTQQMAARREVGRDLHIEIRFDGDAEVRLHAPASRIACSLRILTVSAAAPRTSFIASIWTCMAAALSSGAAARGRDVA